MAKVLFVIPKNKNLFGDEVKTKPGEIVYGSHPHVGIAYLVAVLKRVGVQTRIFDTLIENDDRRLWQVMDEFRPDLIGITGFSYCYNYIKDLTDNVCRRAKCPVVLGGPHVSATRKLSLADNRAQFAIKGEGEITFQELVKEVQKDQPQYEKIDGLIWRRGYEIIENKDRQLITDLDSLPYPDFEAFPLDRYLYTKQHKMPLITSRGCPYGCNYCSVRLSMGRGFRPRSAENVVNEIEYWYHKGWCSFEFNDDCFNVDMNRAKKICDLIVKRGLKIKFELYNGIRVDRIDEELLRKMKKAGCIFISYGCEAGNQKIIDRIGKHIKLEQVRRAVELTNKVGIKNSVNFIIGHPGETYQTAMDSINFARSLPTNFVNFYNLVPYPGTQLYDWVKREAKFLVPEKDYLRYISYRDNRPIFETKEFSRAERMKVIQKGFNLYERRVLEFRLGKTKGDAVYCLTRLGPVGKWARQFALENKLGNKIYQRLSTRSRRADK